MEETQSIDYKLKKLMELHTHALENWPGDGSERSKVSYRRLQASAEVVEKALQWLEECRLFNPDEDLKVYALFINYLEHYQTQALWKPVHYDDPMEVASFQGALKGYNMIDERIYS